MRWVLLLLLACPVNAQKLKNWAPQFQNKFCGLDTLHDSAYLDDCDAQAAQNVLTDRGYLEERPGNLRIASILSGFPVKQVYEYVSPSNVRFLIAHASNTVYQSNLSGSPVVLSTIAANQNLECTMLYGVLICDDGAGTPWSFNGTSTAAVNGGMPICNLLDSEYGRVLCGAPSTDLSQVAVSSYPSYNTWTPAAISPLPANSANSFEFSPNDGDSIQCMKRTPWGEFVGKKNSSYILKGYDNNTFYVQTIDPVIGCVDQRTVQVVNGVLTWASYKGVYQWPGSGPAIWISEKIDPTYRGIRQLSSNSNFWEIQTQAAWQSGTFTTNGPKNTWDSTSVPGYILPSSSTFQDNTTVAFSSGNTFTSIDTMTVTNAIQVSSITYIDLWPACAINAIAGNLGWAAQANNWRCQQDSNVVGSTYSYIYGADNSSTNLIDVIGTSSVTISTGSWGFIHAYNPGSSGGAYTCSGDGLAGSSCFEFRYVNAGGNYYAVNLIEASSNLHTAQILKNIGGTKTILSSYQFAVSTGIGGYDRTTNHQWQVIRQSSGTNYLYIDNVFIASTTADTSVAQSTGVTIAVSAGVNSNEYNEFTNMYFYTYYATAAFVSRIFDTQFSTPTYGVLSDTYTVALDNIEGQVSFFTRVSTSPNNDMWDAFSASSDTLAIGSAQKRYTEYEVLFNNYIATKTMSLSGVGYTAISTGIYYSPVDFIGTKISSWKQINIQDYQQTAGEFQYYVRSASYTFTALATAPAWVAQPNNDTVVVATGAYFEWKVDSSSITSSSQAVTSANASIAKSIVNWQEGTSVQPASAFIDQRYFLCVILSTSDTINDGCLILQRNKSWILFNGPSISAMSPFNFQVIGGDGSSNSKVWYLMQSGIYDDDGSAISSSWTTKDFIIGSPFNLKSFYELWTDNQYSQGSTLNVGYALDKGSMNFRTFALDSSANNPTQLNLNTVVTRTGPTIGSSGGKYIRFNFNQNLLDLPWRLNSYMFYVDVQERTTS